VRSGVKEVSEKRQPEKATKNKGKQPEKSKEGQRRKAAATWAKIGLMKLVDEERFYFDWAAARGREWR
jgi:hypothetical protein